MSAYDNQVRDADMEKRKSLMCAALSEAMKVVSGNPDLGRDTEKLIETWARNGVQASFVVITGPYEQKLYSDGTKDYS